jgi:hypothetical protein
MPATVAPHLGTASELDALAVALGAHVLRQLAPSGVRPFVPHAETALRWRLHHLVGRRAAARRAHERRRMLFLLCAGAAVALAVAGGLTRSALKTPQPS